MVGAVLALTGEGWRQNTWKRNKGMTKDEEEKDIYVKETDSRLRSTQTCHA
jgi:hypothetical protein